MMKKRGIHISLVLLAFISGLLGNSCTNGKSVSTSAKDVMIDSLIPEFSHSFRVDCYKGYKVVKVFTAKGGEPTGIYILRKDTTIVPTGFGNAVLLIYPASHLVCMSTTHMGAMEILDARSLIAAVANKDFIYDSLIRLMVGSGSIKDAGKDYQPDYEVIAQCKPDLLFSDGENTGSSQLYAKLKALNIKVVQSRDYFEQDPLARAEWIKFFAAFIGKEKLADSIFNIVKTHYQAQKYQVTMAEKFPTVFCNVPYNGVWYMPCGANYTAKFIEDAGGNFLWAEDRPANGLNLTLNFEQVFERASNVDFWINTGTFTNLAQMASADGKFKLFKAYKTGNVFNSTHRASPNGSGLDIWETGPFRPDRVLDDLVSILHEHFSTETEPYYFERLK